MVLLIGLKTRTQIAHKCEGKNNREIYLGKHCKNFKWTESAKNILIWFKIQKGWFFFSSQKATFFQFVFLEAHHKFEAKILWSRWSRNIRERKKFVTEKVGVDFLNDFFLWRCIKKYQHDNASNAQEHDHPSHVLW